MASKEKLLIDLIDRLSAFYFLARKYGNEILSDVSLTTGERAILRDVERMGPQTVPNMASRRGVSNQAIQRTVETLEKRSLVERSILAADRRVKVVTLTAAGKQLLNTMRAIELREAARFDDFDEAELHLLLESLDLIEARLKRRIDLPG